MRIIYTIIPIIFLFACKTSQPTSEDLSTKEVPHQEIIIELATGTNSGFETAITKVITNQDEFTKVWKQAYNNYLKKPTLPKVDFNEYQVILVALGMKTSGGYSIKIDKIINSNGNYIIAVTELSPGSNCMTTEAITYPFQLVQVKKAIGKISFKITKKTVDCKSE